LCPASGDLEKINTSAREENPATWAEAVKLIAGIVNQHQPRVIFMPHAKDGNSTHVGTHLLVNDALKQVDPAFCCWVCETEFWAPLSNPNLMIESSVADVTDLVTALSFHVGEVGRNPYHVRLPAWMQDNVRRGGSWWVSKGGLCQRFPLLRCIGSGPGSMGNIKRRIRPVNLCRATIIWKIYLAELALKERLLCKQGWPELKLRRQDRLEWKACCARMTLPECMTRFLRKPWCCPTGRNQPMLCHCCFGCLRDVGRELPHDPDPGGKKDRHSLGRIIVAAKHNHSGPATRDSQNESEKDYVQSLVQKVVALIEEAAGRLEPAAIGCASGREKTISHYRRLLADDGHVVMNWEPWPAERIVRPLGVIDPEVGVLKIMSADGKNRLLGVLFNHAGHPNVMSGDNYLITPDYPGRAEVLLEEKGGGLAIFIKRRAGVDGY